MALLGVGRRREAVGWIAIVTATAFLNGCCMRTTAYDVSRIDPPPGGHPQPSGTGTYEEGVRDGESDAEHSTGAVAGYFVLGVVAAPILVLCIAAAASGGSSGGGGGNCGGGGGEFSSGDRYRPMDARGRSNAYLDGYDQGYRSRIEDRRENAFMIGFLTGIVLVAVAVAIVVVSEEERDRVESETGSHMTAGGKRRGAVLFEF